MDVTLLMMENYSKGENKELDLEIPFPDLPESTPQFIVHPGSKMCNIISAALNKLNTDKQLLWIGSGPATTKVISCVEIIKRKNRNLHQLNKIGYKIVEEYWDPKLEDLDQLKVVRRIPTLFVLLSKDLVQRDLGYQAPRSSAEEMWQPIKVKRRRNLNSQKPQRGNHGGRSWNPNNDAQAGYSRSEQGARGYYGRGRSRGRGSSYSERNKVENTSNDHRNNPESTS
ncbi:ribonuclease P protein subunit p25-like protein isoform X2 [Oratosquilla oratoria]|uniref:ribonuclease P protein subunit p25-like protein isoform X2 n=2 Tax=Oratosquilla oratoria TaxID=337810 RepID=UPI003F76431C